MKIIIVLGTRPEVIKLAPVILEGRKAGHSVHVILTGQHQTMALPLLRFFGIFPDLNLDVMEPNQTLTGLSSKIINRLTESASKLCDGADILLVQGDTTTAFIAAYWAFCRGIKVGHIEAGLRTNDLKSPFPEEANRQLIGRIASVHFAPTIAAVESLHKENIDPDTVHLVGNTAIDALKYTLNQIDNKNVAKENKLSEEIINFVSDHKLVLVTAHRRESFGEGLIGICRGIRAIVDARPDVRIVYPVHPNPNVRGPVEHLLGDHEQILLCPTQSYVPFVSLMKRADVLLTDSGGIQEEGPALRKPIVVMREKTERPEGIRAGFSVLVGTNPELILDATLQALETGCCGQGKNPYGDGRASERIISALQAVEYKQVAAF